MSQGDTSNQMPNWLRQMRGSEETPDWLLRLIREAERGSALPGLDDAVEEMGFASPDTVSPAIPETPDARAEIGDLFGPVEEQGKPETVIPAGLAGGQDWLSGLDAGLAAADTLPANEGSLDWLDNLAEVAPADETASAREQPAELGSEAEVPSWLSGLEQEPAPEISAVTPSEGVPEWLSGLEQETPGPVEASEVAASAEETPAWLSGLEQGVPDLLETAPPGVTAGDRHGDSEDEALFADSAPGWLSGLDEGMAFGKASSAESSGGLPAWMSGLDDEETEETTIVTEESVTEGAATEEAEPEISTDMPDWLTSLEGEEDIQGPPAWMAGLGQGAPLGQEPAEGGEEDLPAWMAGLVEEPTEEAMVAPEVAVPEEVAGTADWLMDAEEEGEAEETPDWLSDLGEGTPLEGAEPTEGGEEGLPAWMGGLGEETPEGAQAAVPEWLSSIDEHEPGGTEAPSLADQEILDVLEASQEPVAPADDEETPEWLQSMGEVPTTDETVESKGVTAWLHDVRDMPVPEETVPEEEAEEEIPTWLQGMDIGGSAPSEEAEVEQGFETEMPDWLREMPPEEMAAAAPSGRAEEPVSPPSLGAPLPGTPSWMQDVYSVESEAPPADDTLVLPSREDVATGETPDWLEALREKEEVPQEEELPVETSGPLAGLRGVLNPEPLLAILPKSTYKPESPILDAHRAEANAVSQLLAQPVRRSTVVSRSPGRQIMASLGRWLIYLVLLGAMLVAPLQAWIRPPDLLEARSFFYAIDALEPGNEVLLVIDYEASLDGELTAQTRAIIWHLLHKNLGIVAVSMTPQGPTIVQDLLAEISSAVAGEHYLNLGYLPAHPASLHAFVDAPLAGSKPLGVGNVPPAETSLGRRITQFGDLDLIVAVSGDPGHVRWWIEQVGSRTRSDMLAAVTASAAPYLRPYYDERGIGPLKGILAGLGAAVQYEQLSGTQPLLSAWPNYVVQVNAQMLLATIVFLSGVGSVVLSVIRRRRGDK